MAKLSAFTAYFDAAGHPSDQPFVVVSGYVANAHQWKLFNGQWKSVHDYYKIGMPFHASDYYARKKQYEKWPFNDAEAGQFIVDLASVQQIYMLAHFSCIVDMGLYREIDDVFMLDTMIPAYALGARACIALINTWQKQFDIRYPIECIFEDGDFGKGKFMDLMRVENCPRQFSKTRKTSPAFRLLTILHGNRAIF